jgi:hypothetical protein
VLHSQKSSIQTSKGKFGDIMRTSYDVGIEKRMKRRKRNRNRKLGITIKGYEAMTDL